MLCGFFMGYKLYMILLGCRPPGRHVEQHDYFFVIGTSLKEVKQLIRGFWSEAPKIHIDAWREVTSVEGFKVEVVEKAGAETDIPLNKIFFINLGGYQQGKFEEQHYTLLTVKQQKAEAFSEAKQTLFYQHNHFENAASHISTTGTV